MRRSPSVDCPFCNGRDWSYDQDKLRWVCNSCLVAGTPIPDRPIFEENFEFRGWYDSSMDDWNTIQRYIADLEKEQPTTERDRIIHGARLKKAQSELSHANDLATIATSIRMIMDNIPSGDIYIKTSDVELRVKW